MNSPLLPITLLLLFTSLCFSFCDHDHHEGHQLAHISDSDYPEDRILAVSERQSIHLEEFPNAAAAKFQEQLLPAAISYLETTFKVNRLSNNLTATLPQISLCDIQNPPQVLLNEGIPADLAIFITGYTEESTSKASARPCGLHKPTNRPVLGVVRYNLFYDWTGMDSYSYETHLAITLHEIGHVLGFSQDLYLYFIDPVTGRNLENSIKVKEVNGIQTTILSLEPLTKRLRNYFNCPSLEGAYLENQGTTGSQGSHFERRIFYNEVMTASIIEDSRISEFSLAFFQGTGWYTPDYTMAEPVFWGKGKGCEFVNSKCINPGKEPISSEFCNERGTEGCSFYGRSKGFCGAYQLATDNTLNSAFDYFGDKKIVTDTFADNCPLYQDSADSNCNNPENLKAKLIVGETLGPDSMCFTGTLYGKQALSKTGMYCIDQMCQEVGPQQYVLTVYIGGEVYFCPEGMSITIKGYEGHLNCPNDITEFCSTKALRYCKRGCMGRGVCNNGECVCNPGYGGLGCSLKVKPEVHDVQKLPWHLIAISVVVILVAIGLVFVKVMSKMNQKKIQQQPDQMKIPKGTENSVMSETKDVSNNKEETKSTAEFSVDISRGIQSQVSYSEESQIR